MRRLQQDLLVVVERVMSESTIRGGESWKERDGGNIWDELGSRWEGGGGWSGWALFGEDNDLVLGNWTLICFNLLPAVFGLYQDQS